MSPNQEAGSDRNPETAGSATSDTREIFRRLFRPAAACLAGFVATAFLIHTRVEWRPHIESYSDKLDFYARNRDAFAVVFVGDSGVRAHVDPALFDRVVSKAGFSITSFNFGIESLSLIEMRTLVEEIARMKAPALRYVLLEPPFHNLMQPENLASARSVYFHDYGNTRLEIACDLSLPWRRPMAPLSALAGVYHYANLGRLAGLFSRVAPERTLGPANADFEARGFLPQEMVATPGLLKWREDFLKNIQAHGRELRAERRLPDNAPEQFVPHSEAMFRMAETLRASAAEPVFLLTPAFENTWPYLQFEEHHRRRGSDVALLSYLRGCDEVYDPRYWYDVGHLNGEGARLFTNCLAEDFVVHLRSGGRG